MSKNLWNTENPQQLGYLPEIIRADDPRPLREQIADRYAHGGGYHELSGFGLTDGDTGSGKAKLHYPGDPDLNEVGRLQVNDELFIVFDYAFVALVDASGTFTVMRMD